jgi:hypothetical protein
MALIGAIYLSQVPQLDELFHKNEWFLCVIWSNRAIFIEKPPKLLILLAEEE